MIQCSQTGWVVLLRRAMRIEPPAISATPPIATKAVMSPPVNAKPDPALDPASAALLGSVSDKTSGSTGDRTVVGAIVVETGP